MDGGAIDLILVVGLSPRYHQIHPYWKNGKETWVDGVWFYGVHSPMKSITKSIDLTKVTTPTTGGDESLDSDKELMIIIMNSYREWIRKWNNCPMHKSNYWRSRKWRRCYLYR